MDKSLDLEIQYVKGIGPKLAEKLHKLGIRTATDLIFYWPRRYEDYTNITKIGDIGNPKSQIPNPKQISNPKNQNNNLTIEQYSNYFAIRARIIGISNKLTSRQRMKVTEAVVEDGTGTIKLIWFNQPFLQKMLKPGSEWIFRGKVDYNNFTNEWVMESPTRVNKPCIIPIYPTTSGLSSLYIAKMIKGQAHRIAKQADFLPPEIMKKYELLSLQQALLRIHTPANFGEIEAARKRLAFDELFLIALRSRLTKLELKKERAASISADEKSMTDFIANLPFGLTGDQKKASEQILADLKEGKPMNRLLNGDVGSGKTVVAAIAAYSVIKAGHKVALMVPTEVLATQHFETFSKFFTGYDITVGLLTSNLKKNSMTAGQPREGAPLGLDSKSAKTEPEGADIIIGTQALLQRSANLENIGLIIVDEQHRFGVKQRAQIKSFSARQLDSKTVKVFTKTADKLTSYPADLLEYIPHFLSMTATPIPRTLHLALFGDLDVSVINEKPKNRKEIKTRFVESQNRMKAYDFIRAHIKSGRQVFVICPLIEESEPSFLSSSGEQSETRGSFDNKIPAFAGMTTQEELFDQDKKSVVKEYEKLSKEIFAEFKVAMLHGKIKSKEKEEILTGFAARKFDILVSTSVIEVGIDIPNASVMMIGDAERFGLAQIHQFRGRVGRGEHQSFCFLFSNTGSEIALQRLKSLETTSDGFKLAEIDLEMRGPGDVFGTMQSGQMELKMASFSDRILIECASRAASEILTRDPHLDSFVAIKEKLAEFEASRHME